MARPADWTPLGLAADPVPGDPERISQQAAHLSRVARTISDEVAALRKIAAGGADAALKGQYADQIHSSASELAGQLEKVEGRYREVSSAMSQWVPDLEHAQSQSITALNQAEGPYQRIAYATKPPTVTNPTPAQQQEARDYTTSMTRAQDELDAAKALLARAVSFRDQQASHCAAVINKAIDDGVKDSWWDHFKEWVSRNAWWLKDLATALEVIATLVAIAALIFTGIGILVLIGFAVTAAALLVRTLLAATGSGSWLDVAVDAFALLTFGLGKFATTAMRGTVAATRGVADELVAGERAASTLGKVGTFLERGAAFMKETAATKISGTVFEKLAPMVNKIGDLAEQAGTGLLEKASPSMEKTLATVSEDAKPLATVAYGGEKDNLILSRTMKAIVGRFPDDPRIAALNTEFTSNLHLAQVLFGSGIGADLSTKMTGGLEIVGRNGVPVRIPVLNIPASTDIPVMSEWYKKTLADPLTTSGGLTTAQANDIVNAMQLTPLGPAAGRFRAVLGGGW
jgi:hypothetical protein